jgi:quercetin dioxygenase-like cupin family protein
VAGDVIQIPARQLHGFVTLTDNVQLACLHAINRADPKTLTETED